MIVHQLKLLVFCWPTCDNTQSDAHRMQEVLSFMITVDFFVKSPWIASTAQNPKYHSIIALWFNRLPFFWSIGQNSLKDVLCNASWPHQYDCWWLSCKIRTSWIHNTQFKYSQYNCSMVTVACSYLADKSKYTVNCNRRCSVHALNRGARNKDQIVPSSKLQWKSHWSYSIVDIKLFLRQFLRHLMLASY